MLLEPLAVPSLPLLLPEPQGELLLLGAAVLLLLPEAQSLAAEDWLAQALMLALGDSEALLLPELL